MNQSEKPTAECHALACVGIKSGEINRDEYRRYTVFPAPQEIRQLGWTDARSIRLVFRERTVNGKTSQELIYFVSSLPPRVRKIAKQIRDHWKVENTLHWSLDVTFAEDTSRIRKGSGPANAAIFSATGVIDCEAGSERENEHETETTESELAFPQFTAIFNRKPGLISCDCLEPHPTSTYATSGLR